MSTKNYLMLLLLGFCLSSCRMNVNFSNAVDGEGAITEKTYPLDHSFDILKVASGWDVELIKSNQPKIVVITEKNLQPLFSYSLKNETLTLSTSQNIGHSESRKIKMYYTQLHQISASSGSELFSSEEFNQADLKVTASSGAEISLLLKTKNASVSASSGSAIQLRGTSINLTAETSSGAVANLAPLETKNATGKASSGGNLQVFVTNTLKATTSSGGTISYKGNPKHKTTNQGLSGGQITSKSLGLPTSPALLLTFPIL